MKVLGVDEAGRGAVIGPLVVAGVLAEGGSEGKLRSLGARDSKSIPREKRKEILCGIVREALGARVVVIGPAEIDRESLTQLELEAVASLIAYLRPHEVVLDSPVHPKAIPGFLRRLVGLLGENGVPLPRRIDIRPRADTSSPVVGAASILAKVTRDAYVAYLRRRYGDFGWGYPGEGKALEFLLSWWREHGSLPPICRRRWSTVAGIISPPLDL